MILSDFGLKIAGETGVKALMEDLGAAARAAASGGPRPRMLGGGNPARIPALEAVWRERAAELAADAEAFGRSLCAYDSAEGTFAFRSAMAGLLRREYGWDLGPQNVCVTNGSQAAMWYLLNLFSGRSGGGSPRRILFPLMPEYVGYADQGAEPGTFLTCLPRVESEGPGRFKYSVDFDAVEGVLRDRSSGVGAMVVSRPTNPSGNVLSGAELRRLAALAEASAVPLVVDNAYGLPFPGIVFGEAEPYWDPNVVLSMSLSKVGLPSARTGIVVAREEIIRALAAANAVAGLATGTFGQVLVEPLVASGRILDLCRAQLLPAYRAKRELALSLLDEGLAGLPARVHESGGAIFLWLWLDGLPIDSRELYGRLKDRGVVVLPGEYFAFGTLPDGTDARAWDHPRRCVRINYAAERRDVEEGLSILAEEVRAAYAGRRT